MNAPDAHGETWEQSNQRYLVGAMAELRVRLERSDSAPQGTGDAGAVRAAMTHPPALDTLCSAFGLSAFERALLLLAAACELDGDIPRVCAEAQRDASRTHPTFGLALATLPDPHWDALAPTAPLRRWRLLDVGPGPSLVTSPLRIDERVLHYLSGVRYLDERLTALVRQVEPAGELAPSHRSLAERVAALWSVATHPTPLPVIQLCGPDGVACGQVAAWAGMTVGAPVAAIAAHLVPSDAAEHDALVRLWQREAILAGCALLVECGETMSGDRPREWAIDRLLERAGGLVLVSTRDPRRDLRRATVTIDVPRPTQEEQRDLWRLELGPSSGAQEDRIEELVAHFDIGTARIRAACAEALTPPPSGPDELGERLWDACRGQGRPRLDDLAQRIQPRAEWGDLVLPVALLDGLRQIAFQVRHRPTVYGAWGLGRRAVQGLGISVLFSGSSGTGKTMAAEVLAGDLRLDLYRVDLSQVVSKYIGETEKNLRRIFDTAEEGGAVLLFDEADALFGKRTEIRDSHDRYANIEVSYLLQRMETYRGLAILTTNLKGAMDSAFLRRLRFVLQFPFPDATMRADIWRRVFPDSTPTGELDFARLARLNVAGGNIVNIALNAAFLAAAERRPVSMAHMLAAARTEFAKLERPFTMAELGEAS
jgi:ATPase family associated with various cellular activities (AAA)